MRAVNVILSIAIAAMLALLVFEGGLRLLGFGPPDTLNEFNASLGWAKQAGKSLTRTGKGFEATFEINELGLRDDPMSSPAKPAEAFRVVVLGDSFTLGYTVERDDLFVDLLARRWNEEGRRVDVVNAGTEGYSTDQEVAWLLENGASFDPDLVVLVPYENDIYWNGQERYNRFPKPRFDAEGNLVAGHIEDPGPMPWSQRLATLRLFSKPTADTFVPEGGARPILKEFAPLLESPPDFVDEALACTRGTLLALREHCAELGSELVVAPIPSHSAIDTEMAELFGRTRLGLARSRWSPDKPVDVFLDLSRELGITSVDARADLRKATRDEGDCYYHLIDNAEWHFNPRGNRVFAELLHAELDRLGLVPPPGSAGAVAAVGAAEEPTSAGGVPTWLVVFVVLWLLLTIGYSVQYRDEPLWKPPLEVGALLAVVFGTVLGLAALIDLVDPNVGRVIAIGFVLLVLGFIAYKLGDRLVTIAELFKAFTLRGHWYLMPVVVVLLTVGSLLVVAATSPFVAPFIYTLF